MICVKSTPKFSGSSSKINYALGKSLPVYIYWYYIILTVSDTREAAFVYAITAAGVVFAVTEACSTGRLLQCTCDNNIRDVATDGEWEWGGCGDNVEFGYQKSREFMDARRRKKRRGDVTTLIQLHNNEAGRQVYKQFIFLTRRGRITAHFALWKCVIIVWNSPWLKTSRFVLLLHVFYFWHVQVHKSGKNIRENLTTRKAVAQNYYFTICLICLLNNL